MGKTVVNKTTRTKVAYIYPYSFRYRAPFNESLRKVLATHDIEYDFIFSSDPKFKNPRGDFVKLPWASDVTCRLFNVKGMELRYQHAFRKALSNDLIILQQENGLLVNYLLIVAFRFLGKKTAYFGHGQNFQAEIQNSLQERFKKFWINKVDWWFAYTQLSADIVIKSGFPEERITNFNNAIDTSAIQQEKATISTEELIELKTQLGIESDNIGIYIGAMYKQKRLEFLIEAALLIRQQVPDFHLLLLGAGTDAEIAKNAAKQHNFIHYLGPKFGREKTMLAMISKVFLMPGLVGLAVLDSFAYDLPLVTTNLPYHSPEIAYLKHEINGLITPDPENVVAYATALVKLLQDKKYYQKLRTAATQASKDYSIEDMVERFSQGILQALKSK